MSYTRPAAHHEVALEVKKSRFISWIGPAESREAALSYLAEARKHYPDARHHCWAYLIGNPVQTPLQACSDDGEPGGTAGKPILNVLQHKAVGDVMLIVTRYFGGIKLGAGGLVRAYSQAAQLAYETARFDERVAHHTRTLQCSFQHEQSVRHWLEKHQGRVKDITYGAAVQMQVSFPEAESSRFSAWLEQFPGIHLQRD